MAESATPQRSWFMNEPFQKNAVYSLLANADYDFVVGLDVGHGETVAYLFCLEDNAGLRVERLRLNHEDDARLPTLVRFSGDRAIIGRKARNVPGFFQHFKVAPGSWDTDLGQGHTCGQLMEAFIRTLWQQILQYQPELAAAVAKNRALVTVGCPASGEWTGVQALAQYRALLKRATGCAHIAVLPESTAAIMAALLDAGETAAGSVVRPGEAEARRDIWTERLLAALGFIPPSPWPPSRSQLWLERGIAVLDAGSSTLDFTYVQLGKALITRSLRLGGHDLDEQMLAVAMEDSGLVRSQIPAEQLPTLLMQLRELKEAFYPAGESLGIQLIPIWGRDGEGRADPDLPGDLQLKFTVNRAFMERALNRPGLRPAGIPSGKDARAQSWLTCFQEFVQYTRTLCPDCDRIILTGGTSFVTQVKEMVSGCYGGEVVQSKNPSASVARGLGYAKSLECRGRRYLEEYRAFGKRCGEEQYRAFLPDLSSYIARVVCGTMKDCAAALADNGHTIPLGNFIQEVNYWVLKNPYLVGKIGRQQVEELFARHFLKGVSRTHQEANRISARIYGANVQWAPQLPVLTEDQLTALASRVDLSEVIGEVWLSAMAPDAIFSILSTMLLVIAAAIFFLLPGISLVLVSLALALNLQNFREKITEFAIHDHTAMKPWMLRRVVNSLKNEASRQKTLDKAAGKAAEAMEKAGIFRDEMTTMVESQAEIALGKVLFLVYDNRPS